MRSAGAQVGIDTCAWRYSTVSGLVEQILFVSIAIDTPYRAGIF